MARQLKRLRLVATGGTFDELHRGHKFLLRGAFRVGRRVIIGVSSDNLVRRMRKRHPVAGYSARKRNLERYLKAAGLLKRAIIVGLDDRYGPTAFDPTIQAIIVTKDTENTAHSVNRIRVRKGLKRLAVIRVPLAVAEDQKPMSSTRIRRREINSEGYLVDP